MKRKFILLPITLTVLAPTIGLVGCGDPDKPEPEPEYIDIELDYEEGNTFKSCRFDLEKSKYYNFYIKGAPVNADDFYIMSNDGQLLKSDIEMNKYLVNNKECSFEIQPGECWEISIKFAVGDNINIYLKPNISIKGVTAICDD